MDVLFKDVIGYLKTITEIKWIDEDCGQLDIYQDPPVVFPCALISVQVPEWISIKEPAVQPGKAQVVLKMGFDTRIIIGNAPTLQLTKAFEHFAIVKKVTFALRGKYGTTYKGLERLSTLKTINEVGIKIYTITFSCSIAEIIAAPVFTP
jgi:hypothetical protein